MIPLKTEPTQPKMPPMSPINLIPLPQERPTPSAKTNISQSSPIAPSSPPPSPDSPPVNIPQTVPSKITKNAIPPSPSPTVLVTPPIVQSPTSPEPITPKLQNPPETPKPEIENPAQFAIRTQKALGEVTGKIGQQYGDRFAERSETIAASPELFFTQPELFYDKKGTPLSGFNGKPFQIEEETPEQAFKVFEANFKTSGFTILALENYGGGPLYEVKSKREGNPEKVAFYLNLLPIPNQSGTIVVIWTRRPSKE